MTDTKKRKRNGKTIRQALVSDNPIEQDHAVEVATSSEYQEYLKEHNRKLRQLEREASGRNMVEPW